MQAFRPSIASAWLRARAKGCLAALWLMLLLAGAGCGDHKHAVTGLVTLNGKPLTRATLVFELEGTNGARPSVGQTDDDGVFHLRTVNPDDGAPAGTYRVTITKTEHRRKAAPRGGATLDKLALTNLEVQLKQMVQVGKITQPELDTRLEEAKKPRFFVDATVQVVPAKYTNSATTPLRATIPSPSGTLEFNLIGS